MAADELRSMKRDELGYFLRARGIPFSDRNKNDRLTLSQHAVDKNLPVIPTVSEDLATAEAEVNQKLTLEGGMIRLPNPRKMTAGWSPSFSCFPDTTRVEVEQYITKCSKIHGVATEGSKSLKEGESLYLSGHVTGVEYHRISPNLNYCFICATVCRQMAVTQDPYTTWVILHKKTGDVESAYCTCPAGLRSFCKHVMALLHFIVREVEGGCNVACTSRPQEWHKPHKKGKKIQQPDFVKNIKIKKIKGTFDSSPNDTASNKKRLNFEPRALCHQRQKFLKDFDLQKLSEITDGNCGVLLYAPRQEQDKVLCAQPDMTIINETVDICTSVKGLGDIDSEIKASNNNIDLETYSEMLWNEMQLDDEQIKYVANSTKDQRHSALWFHLREGRITSSVMKECMGKVDDRGSLSCRNMSFLGKVLRYTDPIETKEMKWGNSMEARAISQYKQMQNKIHNSLQVTQCGLFICKENPFIAGSPDAAVSCSCCGNGVLEVKNPYSARHLSISEYVNLKSSCLSISDGVVILKRNHEYFAQVQVEMYVTSSAYADFVVRTGNDIDNIHIERIFPDHEFISQMVDKSRQVFLKIIVPEMFGRKWKHESDVKFVEKVLSDVVDKSLSLVSED